MTLTIAIYELLVRVALGSLLLTALAAAGVLLVGQPARRIRVIQATLAGLCALPLLMLVPGYPRWQILPALPATAKAEPSDPSPQPDFESPAEPTIEHALSEPASEFIAPPAERFVVDEPQPAESPATLSEIDEPAPASIETAPALVIGTAPTSDAASPELQPTISSAPPPSMKQQAKTLPKTTKPAPGEWRTLDARRAIVAAYATGVIVMAGWWLLGLLAVRRLLRSASPAPPECRIILRAVGGPASDRVSLLVSARAAQPCALAWRPTTIVLPEALVAEADPQALRWALAHEWSHVERGDLLSWTASGIVRCFYFYQPLLWWLRTQLQLCQDFVADAAAARAGGVPEDYAEFLTTSSFTRPTLAAGLGIGGRISDLRRRIIMLVERRRVVENASPRRWNLALVPIVVLVVAISAGLAQKQEKPAEPAKPAIAAEPAAASPAAEPAVPTDAAAPAAPAEVVGPIEDEPSAETFDPFSAAEPAATKPAKPAKKRLKPKAPAEVAAPSAADPFAPLAEVEAPDKVETPAPVAAPANPDAARKIQPLDVLGIQIIPPGGTAMIKLTGQYVVEPGGDIAFRHPYGRLNLKNKSLGEAELAIANYLLQTAPNVPSANVRIIRMGKAKWAAGRDKSTFKVAGGDRLDVKTSGVPRDPDPNSQEFNLSLEGVFAVDGGGVLELSDDYGSVNIAGQSLPEVAESLKDYFRQFVADPQVTVSLAGDPKGNFERLSIQVPPPATYPLSLPSATYAPAPAVAPQPVQTILTPPAQSTPVRAPRAVHGKPLTTGTFQPKPQAPAGPRKIAPGDVLVIDVMDNLEPNSPLKMLLKPGTVSVVDGEGSISLGSAYGNIGVAGSTLRDAEKKVADVVQVHLLQRAERLDREREASENKEGLLKGFFRGQLKLAQINVRLAFADDLGNELAQRDLALMDPQSDATPTGPTVSPYLSLVQTRPELIQPGDTLNFEFEPPEANLKRSAVVESSGNVALGVSYGRVNLAGKSVEESEKIVKDVLGKAFDHPQVQITFGARASRDMHIEWDSPRKLNANERLEQLEKENRELKAELRKLQGLKSTKRETTIEVPLKPNAEEAPKVISPEAPKLESKR